MVKGRKKAHKLFQHEIFAPHPKRKNGTHINFFGGILGVKNGVPNGNSACAETASQRPASSLSSVSSLSSFYFSLFLVLFFFFSFPSLLLFLICFSLYLFHFVFLLSVSFLCLLLVVLSSFSSSFFIFIFFLLLPLDRAPHRLAPSSGSVFLCYVDAFARPLQTTKFCISLQDQCFGALYV